MPIHLPNLRCLPDFVVGIPVISAAFLRSFVIPSARFQENEMPGPSFIVNPQKDRFLLLESTVIYDHHVDKPTRNGSLAPAILGVAGLLAFIGSSSAWIRVSFIQIRGLDYWFGFITAISASVIIASGFISFKKSLVSPKWQKNWVIYSLLSSIISITILIAVANRVDQIGEEISKKAELPDSFVGGLLLGVLGRVIGKATNSVAEFIKPKLAEGFYITLASFVLAAATSMFLLYRDAKRKSGIQLDH